MWELQSCYVAGGSYTWVRAKVPQSFFAADSGGRRQFVGCAASRNREMLWAWGAGCRFSSSSTREQLID